MIDTPEKRRMAIDFGKIRGTGMPVPMGNLFAASRAHVLNLYFEVGVPVIKYFWRNKNLIGGIWTSKIDPSSAWSSKSAPTSSWQPKVNPGDGLTQEI